jgi:eukaryotic-like serine/threonine-protein kinase
MTLAAGTKLGPYEVQSPLGTGGMGEVYRALDTRLERTVAVKVLPSHLSTDPELGQRFDREARAISALQHPHICTLYDVGHQDGIDFLVMEYLEGETLADRLQKGPLPLDQVLQIGAEIAYALDKAHGHGIIHRDLKPGNIILTKSGAKLTDFGLAKRSAAAVASDAATLATGKPLTREGTLIGTFQYMSPEQLEGKEADARSDIFALGAVLYEMTTGRPAFAGKSQISVLAAILEREPEPISGLQPASPPALDRAIRTCLAKAPDKRLQSSHDLAVLLEWIAHDNVFAGTGAPVDNRWRNSWLWAIGAAAVLAAAILTLVYIRAAPKPEAVVWSSILPPEKSQFTLSSTESGPIVISPDGRRIAFSARNEQGKIVLWVRPLNSLTAQPLEGTEGASYPFWSPDGQYVGFFSQGKLKKIDLSGGPPQTLCDAPTGRGGSWGPDGTIIFTPSPTSAMQRVSATGGTPSDIMEAESRFLSQRWPSFLPDGRHFVYFDRNVSIPHETGIYLGQLGSKIHKFLLENDSNAIYASGYLLYLRNGVLFAKPFDMARLQFTGDARPVAENVAGNATVARAAFSASDNGVLVFQQGSSSSGGNSLVWLDRNGKQLGTAIEGGGEYSWQHISPDGRTLAVQVGALGGFSDIWVVDLVRGTRSRLTFGPGTSFSPVWSPDGMKIYYSAIRTGIPHIYAKAADGTGKEEVVYDGGADERVRSISKDGRYLLFERLAAGSNTKQDIWALPLIGDRKPFPLVQTEFTEIEPFISPDGKWVAYRSDQSGRSEVYMTSFPVATSKLQVSTSGGQSPRWRPDGKELFFVADDRHIMSVEVSTRGNGLALSVPHALSTSNLNDPGFSLAGFGSVEVAPDGKRLLVSMTKNTEQAQPATIVVNWPAELKK